jgi:hypothetical protein
MISEKELMPDPPKEDEKPLSQQELTKWFGSHMPTEVVNILFTKQGDGMTVGQVRAKVRQLARELVSAESLLTQAKDLITDLDGHEGAEGWSAKTRENMALFNQRYHIWANGGIR